MLVVVPPSPLLAVNPLPGLNLMWKRNLVDLAPLAGGCCRLSGGFPVRRVVVASGRIGTRKVDVVESLLLPLLLAGGDTLACQEA